MARDSCKNVDEGNVGGLQEAMICCDSERRTPPKIEASQKRILSFWGPVPFQGRAVKLLGCKFPATVANPKAQGFMIWVTFMRKRSPSCLG